MKAGKRFGQTQRALIASLALLMLPYGARSASALHFTESFMNSTAPGWVLSGSAVLTSGGVDPAGSGFLRLTPATDNKAGLAFYDSAFPLQDGLVVQFDYIPWGGGGIFTPGADGVAFALFDGSTASPSVGTVGGSLGYSSDRFCGSDGLTNAYVGIGLDEFGQFCERANCDKSDGSGCGTDNVTIRGAGNGKSGYHFLTSVSVSQLDFPSATTRPPASDFRHVKIVITPNLKVSVYITFGAPGTPQTVISGFDLGAAQAPPPLSVKLALTGATGADDNYHDIRNFSVSDFQAPAPALSWPMLAFLFVSLTMAALWRLRSARQRG